MASGSEDEKASPSTSKKRSHQNNRVKFDLEGSQMIDEDEAEDLDKVDEFVQFSSSVSVDSHSNGSSPSAKLSPSYEKKSNSKRYAR